MKTPVIVNSCGAFPEVVEESGGGFIYNNRSEIIDTKNNLAENPALRDELGNKGYNRIIGVGPFRFILLPIAPFFQIIAQKTRS